MIVTWGFSVILLSLNLLTGVFGPTPPTRDQVVWAHAVLAHRRAQQLTPSRPAPSIGD